MLYILNNKGGDKINYYRHTRVPGGNLAKMFSTISRNAYLLAAFAIAYTGSVAAVNEFIQPIVSGGRV
ncbi:MAG: hypothetical protein ACJAU1_000428 [Psychromonas sp.]|jgi:hypothetical protein